jgi:uncharacterized protein
MSLRFEWDAIKAAANVCKHSISFEEAVTVFGDSQSITIYDELHSDEEDRFIDIGMSESWRLLVVVYVERENSIRIISCRQAAYKEIIQYESQSY